MFLFLFSLYSFTSRDLFNFRKLIFNDLHISCAMLMSIKKYSMRSLFIIALIFYSFSRFNVQLTIINASSKKLSSNLQASIFITFISFIFVAIVTKIIFFSTHYLDQKCFSSTFYQNC